MKRHNEHNITLDEDHKTVAAFEKYLSVTVYSYIQKILQNGLQAAKKAMLSMKKRYQR